MTRFPVGSQVLVTMSNNQVPPFVGTVKRIDTSRSLYPFVVKANDPHHLHGTQGVACYESELALIPTYEVVIYDQRRLTFKIHAASEDEAETTALAIYGPDPDDTQELQSIEFELKSIQVYPT